MISNYIVNGTKSTLNGKIGEENIFKCNTTGLYRTWHNNGQLRYKVNIIKNLEQALLNGIIEMVKLVRL